MASEEPALAERVSYLDNSATTPVDPRVVEAMMPFLTGGFGNPSSLHRVGRQARVAVDTAREQVAALIGASPSEIVFTSSGTESDNFALRGVPAMTNGGPRHLVVSAIEHPAILQTARFLAAQGAQVDTLPVDADGIVAAGALPAILRRDTAIVSVMAANNEVGTIQPIAEVAAITSANGVPFHVDAVAAAGRIPIDVRSTPIDLLTMSAHKIYGPKGVAALFVRRGLELTPLLHGGGQELGRRSATENVAAVVGFGAAAAIAATEMADEAVRQVRLRDRVIDGLAERIGSSYVIGDRYRRLPGHACIGLAGLETQGITVLMALDEAGICVSSGSACSTNHAGQPSHVLTAMGFDPVRARGSLRISLGRFTTDADVDHLLDTLPRVVAGLKSWTSTSLNPDQFAESCR